jgi:hypothetical protein
MTGRTRRGSLICVAVAAAALTAGAVRAQDPPSGVVEPPAILLPNYGRVLIGSQGGMEGGALAVRAKATEAAWYNPAGLVRSKWPSFSANASLYQSITTEFEGGNTTASSSNFTTLPVFVGTSDWVTRGETDRGKLAWGYTIVTPVSWESDVASYDEFDYQGGLDRVTSKAHTDFNTVGFGAVLSYAVTPPYAPPPRFTVGLNAGLYSTSLGIQKSTYDDWRDTATDDTYTSSRELDLSLSAMHLGLTLGAYYGFAPNWECALVARLPGVKLSASGSYDEHELIVNDSDYEYKELDSHADAIEADWKIPLELTAGIAYNGEKFDAELDLSYHSRTGTYEVFPAGSYTYRFGDLATGFTDQTPVRDALTTTGDNVLHAAFGWRYEVSEKFRIHGGLRTAHSHIAQETGDEDFFQAVDLYMVTFGISTQTENTFTSIGIAYGFGETDDFALTDLGSGDPVPGSLSVNTLSFFLGASFKL